MSAARSSGSGISGHNRPVSPPLSNGGVIEKEIEDFQSLGGPPRFDAYRATIFAPQREVLADLRRRTAAYAGEWKTEPHTSGGYAYLLIWDRWERELAVKHGGEQPYLNINSSAGGTSPFVAAFAKQWPHKVTRADVKFDLQGDWQEIADRALKVAERQRRTPDLDWVIDHNGVKGNSLYIGSNKSEFQCIIYDKTRQLRNVKRLGNVPENIVRCEGRWRYKKKERGMAAAKLKPVDYFAQSKMARDIYEELAGEALDPIKLPYADKDSLNNRLITMLAQNRATVLELVEQEGSWQAAGEYLECLMPEAETRREEWLRAQKLRNEAAAARA